MCLDVSVHPGTPRWAAGFWGTASEFGKSRKASRTWQLLCAKWAGQL